MAEKGGNYLVLKCSFGESGEESLCFKNLAVLFFLLKGVILRDLSLDRRFYIKLAFRKSRS